jgi:regulator of sigma E protease
MLNFLINILLVFGILGILILVHELGHFLAARISKVRVDEFAIGLGPKIVGWVRGETHFRLNLLPIGGYVKILGEGDEVTSKKESKDPRNLKNKSKLIRIFVMLAGIIMNILLAVSIYYFFIIRMDYRWEVSPDFRNTKPMFGQIETEKTGDVEYSGLVEDMNAEKAGLPEKGRILEIEGEKLSYSYEVTELLKENKGEEVEMSVCADEICSKYEVKVSEEGTVGIYLYQNYRVFISYAETKLFAGFAHAANVVGLVGEKFGEIWGNAQETGNYSEVVNNVSGPVGVYVIVDYFKGYGALALLGFLADFSLTLGIMNLLPIPALDGGRVLLVIIEAIIGRPLNKKLEALVINISFLLLVVLMIAIIFKDIFTMDQLRSLLK